MDIFKPTIGDVVLYTLTEWDVLQIEHGNTHYAGQVVPLIVVRVWPDEYGPNIDGVNGQLVLDNIQGHLWITSAKQGTGLGTWEPKHAS